MTRSLRRVQQKRAGAVGTQGAHRRNGDRLLSSKINHDSATRMSRKVPMPEDGGNFSREDNIKLFELHATLGCHWKQISENFEGLSDNHIKNIFFAQIRKSLRKARKICGKHSSPSTINGLKPKVLSNFLSKEVLIEDELWGKGEPFPWAPTNPVRTRDFVLYFTFVRPAEVQAMRNARASAIVERIFQLLETMNTQYLEARETEPGAKLGQPMTESQLFRFRSTQMLGREFWQTLRSAEKELHAPSGQEKLAECFRTLGQAALAVAEVVSRSAEFRRDAAQIFAAGEEQTQDGLTSAKVAEELPAEIVSLRPPDRRSTLNPRQTAFPGFFVPDERASRLESSFGRRTSRLQEMDDIFPQHFDPNSPAGENAEKAATRDSRLSLERSSLMRDTRHTIGLGNNLFGGW